MKKITPYQSMIGPTEDLSTAGAEVWRSGWRCGGWSGAMNRLFGDVWLEKIP